MAEHIGGRNVKPAKSGTNPIDLKNVEFTITSAICPNCNIYFDVSLGCPMCKYNVSETK